MTTPQLSTRRTVLLLEHDSALARLSRLGLENDGALVFEARSVEQARSALGDRSLRDGLDGVAVDADGLDNWKPILAEIRNLYPDIRIAAMTGTSTVDLGVDILRVDKGDVPGLVAALNATGTSAPSLGVVTLLLDEQRELESDWQELCRWDPMLPPESSPPIASAVIAAITEAMLRPQPLGWGADPEIEKVITVFSRAVGALDVAIEELVCLREAVRRRVTGRIPLNEINETHDRLQMIVDRAIGAAAVQVTARLAQQAFIDPLTDLLNRRALERDLRREIGRASRYERSFSIFVIDLDGLKAVNDIDGHQAGDEHLRCLATSTRDALRVGDNAYRIGGDEFVLVLAETDEQAISAVAQRIKDAGAPPFSWGAASFPIDGDDLDVLLDLADHRLYDQRRVVRGPDYVPGER